MLGLSKLTRDLSKDHAVMWQKLAAAEMAPERKRGMNIISDTSCIKNWY
jgi:hypothetical protein